MNLCEEKRSIMSSCVELLQDISTDAGLEMDAQLGVEIFDELGPSTSFSGGVSHDIDLHLECHDDGNYSVPIVTNNSNILSHSITGQNVRLRISFPGTPKTSSERETIDKFSCTECEHKFPKHSKLAKHLQHEHNIADGYKCEFCNFSTTENRLLKRHCVNKHSSRKKCSSTKAIQGQTCLYDPSALCAAKLKIRCSETNLDESCAGKRHNFEGNLNKAAVESVNSNRMVSNSFEDTNCSETESMNVADMTPLTKERCGPEVHWNDAETLFQINTVADCMNTTSREMFPDVINATYVLETDSIFDAGLQKKGQEDIQVWQKTECLGRLPQNDTSSETDDMDTSLSKPSLGRDQGTNSGFGCSVCEKVFKTEKSLKRHSLIHVSEKKFACSFEGCHKMFKYSDLLSSHVYKVHKKCNRPSSGKEDTTTYNKSKFICSWTNCGKSFRDNFNLKAHYCLHTGERPVKCSQCPFTCVHKTSLKHHMKVMHR